MDDIERRLRAAMQEATEQPPAGLLEGIRRRHRRHRRRVRGVGVGCVAMATAVALAVPAVVHGLRPAANTQVPAGRPVSPAASAAAAPGTMLLTCDAANWGQLPSNWRSQSLGVGPLWFVDGRTFGYVHKAAGSARAAHHRARRGRLRDGVMIVEVADGSAVVMKPAPRTRSYFRLVRGFDQVRGLRLPRGDTGFTIVACPRGTPRGGNGAVTDFYLGFQIEPGRSAAVNVWTSRTARPVRVIFTCPGRGCEG
jgi:hypothetical protein